MQKLTNNICGIILINKEKLYTSNDVVRKIKKILNTKIGHTGTLDPNATGVLPLLIGDATKVSKYLINHDKEYIATLQLGVKTTTADIEGQVIEEREVDKSVLNEKNVNEKLQLFIGKQEQVPPIYSAIKVNGKKLYQYARNGEKVDIEPRNIEIYNIKLIKINVKDNQIIFDVKCSKGTYIRTLCENIAEKLNSIGYMKELNRVQVGKFNIKDAITISEFEKEIDNKDFSSIIKPEEIFENNPSIDLKENEYAQYINGVPLLKESNNDGVYRVYLNKKFTGIGIIENNKLKRDIVL